jgi:hypothetical protein
VETADAYEREARLLRQLRDQAQEEAAAAKAALSDHQVCAVLCVCVCVCVCALRVGGWVGGAVSR